MKEGKHPKYRKVLFEDSSTGKKAIFHTTAEAKETAMHNGEELPLVRVAVASSSHPYFIGGQQIIDTEGRVDRFKKRYEMAQASMKAKQESMQATPALSIKKKKKS